jgi:NAD(P)H-hydrate epimerase
VSWVLDDETLAAAPGLPPEVMLRRCRHGDGWAAAALEGVTAAVIGPGFGTGEERATDLAAVFDSLRVPACLDADALNLIAADPDLWSRLQAPAVVTPHPKEMARLTGSSVADVQRDRMAAAADLAAQRGCVVVLKGAGTVVAEPSGTAAVIDAGGPALAAGGTGDVLAGLIGGLLAQGIHPPAAARAGALLHAMAGDLAAERFGLSGLRAGDVATAVGEVFARWDR